MKNLIKTVSVVVLSVVMGSAWAECSRSLNAEQMYDCIVAESPSDDSSISGIATKSDTKKTTAEKERSDKQVRAEAVKHVDM